MNKIIKILGNILLGIMLLNLIISMNGLSLTTNENNIKVGNVVQNILWFIAIGIVIAIIIIFIKDKIDKRPKKIQF